MNRFKILVIIFLVLNTLIVKSQDLIKLKPMIFLPELTQNDSILINELSDDRKLRGPENSFDLYDETELYVNFPGGDKALYKFLGKNLIYPDSAIKNKIEGIVIVDFMVDKNGEISNIKIVKGLSSEINQSVIKLISIMPNWIWDKNLDFKKRKSVVKTLPIKFELE